MARKVKSDQVRMGEMAVQIKALDVFQTLMQDPLWSSVAAFWLQADVLGFSTVEKALIRVGIIDINRARANVESTALLEITRESIDLVKSLGASIAVARATGGAVSSEMMGMTLAQALKTGKVTALPPSG